MMIAAGLDMGAKTIKALILRDGEMVGRAIGLGGLEQKENAEKVIARYQPMVDAVIAKYKPRLDGKKGLFQVYLDGEPLLDEPREIGGLGVQKNQKYTLGFLVDADRGTQVEVVIDYVRLVRTVD